MLRNNSQWRPFKLTVPKSALSDSGNRVNEITIIMLFRNNEKYLGYLLPHLEKMKQYYNCRFHFVFAENGSTDNTRALLAAFTEKQSGSLLEPPDRAQLDELPRAARIAAIRNFAADSSARIMSNWTLLIDSDIYFNVDILSKLCAKDPTRNNIGMLCAFGIEGTRFPELEALEKSEFKFIIDNHYYDTAAFDIDGQYYAPHCVFSNCEKCKNVEIRKIDAVGTIQVQSAFGGLALVRSDLIFNPNIRWESQMVADFALCEHRLYCYRLRAETGLSVAIATDVHVIWDVEGFKGD